MCLLWKGGCTRRLGSRPRAQGAQAWRRLEGVVPVESIVPALHVLLGLEVKTWARCPPLHSPEVTDCLCPVLIPVTGSAVPSGFPVVIWHPRDGSVCQNHCSNNILRARHLSLALLLLVLAVLTNTLVNGHCLREGSPRTR